MKGAMPYNSQTNLEQSPLRLPPKLSGDLCKKDGEGRLHLQRDRGHTDSQSSTDMELHSTCSLSHTMHFHGAWYKDTHLPPTCHIYCSTYRSVLTLSPQTRDAQ